MDKFKLNFYNIDACGYYSKSKLKFGNLSEILLDFQSWVKNKTLNETCTFSPDDAKGEILPVYCFDIAVSSNQEDIVLTTWNETETIESGMASVNGLDPVGNPNVETTVVPSGHIPGFPTYFWFSIPYNSFVTIRLDKNRLNGHQGLKLLLEGFLCKFSKYTVIDCTEDSQSETNSNIINTIVLGYRENEEKTLCTKISPRFWTSVKRIDGELDLIRNNRSKISKLLRKDCLNMMEKDDKNIIQKIWDNLGGQANVDMEVKIKYEVSIEDLKQEELEKIIDKWNDDKEEWSNVGFKIDGIPEPKWLSHSIVKTDIEITVDKTEKGILKAESLLNQIIRHKNYLISLMERQQVDS